MMLAFRMNAWNLLCRGMNLFGLSAVVAIFDAYGTFAAMCGNNIIGIGFVQFVNPTLAIVPFHQEPMHDDIYLRLERIYRLGQ